MWLGRVAPASPRSSSATWDFGWPCRRNWTWEVKNLPFLRHDGEAAQKLLCVQQDVCKHREDEANGLPKVLSWLPARLQHPGLRQATPMCVPAFRPERKEVIINSQGCEVPGQEKSNVFEQHLYPAEPASLMPERAAESCHARVYQGGTH